MEPEEALHLYSMHAFDKDSPTKEYLKLSKEAVASTGRLPLALEVAGSHLRDIPYKQWAEISYDALNYRTKQMFLDIACFFIGHEKTCPMYMWDACEFDAKMGLRELIHKSLVKIVVETSFFGKEEKKVKKLWMHDQLRDLGREIVRAKSYKNGVKCNRLWMHEDAVEVVKEEEDKKDIEMLRLCNLDNDSIELYGEEEFSGFRKLRYLECRQARITGDWSCLLPELRWLSCIDCYVDFTISSLKKLVVLDLSECNISEEWSGWSQIKVGNKLKVLDLSYTYLRRTPDLSKFPNLERLILVGCPFLVEIDPSIGKLTGLKFLNVSGCESLQSFPNELCSLNNLEVIWRCNAGGARAFPKDYLRWRQSSRDFSRDFCMPESTGNLGSLLTLVLGDSPIAELPESIGRLSRLRLLSLCVCSCPGRLPDSLADMKSVVVLRLSNTKISELPQRVGQLVKLKILKLDGCQNLKKLPDSIGDMKSLVELDISHSRITELPAAIGMLKRLEICNASGCYSLAKIPSTIGGCTSLRLLNLGGCSRIEKLPDSVGCLRMLAVLNLFCSGISELPDTIWNIKELRVARNDGTTFGVADFHGDDARLVELGDHDSEFRTEVP